MSKSLESGELSYLDQLATAQVQKTFTTSNLPFEDDLVNFRGPLERKIEQLNGGNIKN